MIADRLRAAILQAAISGKLTKQHPEDGTAEELLETIKTERQQLEKEGKIKKQKPLPLMSEEVDLFDVPPAWAWVRLGQLVKYSGSGSTPKGGKAVYVHEGTMFLRSQNIHNDGLRTQDVAFVSQATVETLGSNTVYPGDLLLNITGASIGRAAVVPSGFAPSKTNQHILTIRLIDPRLARYIQTVITSDFGFRQIMQRQNGGTKEGLNSTSALSLPVPVPPVDEQERIAAKLDEVLPLIDQLAELEREREYLDREFAKAIERAILQAAISGKLTDQRPEDGTATELLEQIKAERAALVKAKKLQKQKVLQPVTEESQPFVIPASWEWVRFQDVNQFRIGKTPKRAEPKFWSPSEVPWVSISDMTQGGSIASTKEGVSAAAIAECFGGQTSPAGTLIMSFKLTIGRCSFLGRDAVHNEAIVSIFPAMSAGESFSTYLSHALPLLSQLGDSKAAIKGNTLNSKSIANLPIPLPPPMEQERIAAKLDRALPLARGLGELVS